MDIVIGSWKGTAKNKFSARELEAVLHCANNLTVKQAAKQMSISPDSVTKRLSNAKFKLGVSSIRALVLESLRMGFIAAVSSSAPADPDPKHQRTESTDGIFIA